MIRKKSFIWPKLLGLAVVIFTFNMGTLNAQSIEKIEQHQVQSCKDLESIGRGTDYPGATHSDAWLETDDYILMSDIDCFASSPSSPDHDTSPETNFGADGFDAINLSGNLDGNDYLVDNLVTDSGFIDTLDHGEVKNLSIIGSNFKAGNYVGMLINDNNGGLVSNTSCDECLITNADYGAGGLVGHNYEGTIENSYSKSYVAGNDTVGGLVGYNYGHIINSYANGNVYGGNNVGGLLGSNNYGDITNSYATGNVEGLNNVGGLIGNTSAGSVSYSYANGNVIGGNNVGGLVGNGPESYINHTYATGDVEGTNYTGGLIGYATQDTIVSDSYKYDSAVVSPSDNTYGQSVSLVQLHEPSWHRYVLGSEENWNVEPLVEENYYPHVMSSNENVEIPGQKYIQIP